MGDTRAPFWDRYRELVARLLRPLADGDGCCEQQMAEAERRLGLPLPRLLREFYLAVGMREDINHAFEHLLEPDEIRLAGDTLVFYRENQGVFLWGMDLHSPDPDNSAVVRNDYVDELVWEPYKEYLSSFLAEMLLVQASNGGMPYVGIGWVDVECVVEADASWERVGWGKVRPPGWLLRDGQQALRLGKLHVLHAPHRGHSQTAA